MTIVLLRAPKLSDRAQDALLELPTDARLAFNVALSKRRYGALPAAHFHGPAR